MTPRARYLNAIHSDRIYGGGPKVFGRHLTDDVLITEGREVCRDLSIGDVSRSGMSSALIADTNVIVSAWQAGDIQKFAHRYLCPDA